MAPEADPCAGDTHGPGDTCVVCCDMIVWAWRRNAPWPCSHSHDTPARAPTAPTARRAGDSLARSRRCVSCCEPDAVWGARAHYPSATHTATTHREQKSLHPLPTRLLADSARVPNRLPEHGACDSGPRLTGPGLGDVAVRLRRASLRPGPATADGFAQLRLRRQAPDIQGRWSRATGTWHMTPRDSPLGGASHPLQTTSTPTGPTVASGDHCPCVRLKDGGEDAGDGIAARGQPLSERRCCRPGRLCHRR